MAKKINIRDLRDELIESFDSFKNGKLKHKDAKEIANMAGKVIMTAKIELDYSKFMKLERRIDFLDVEEGD